VDGVFEADPEENPEAKPFRKISYQEVMRKNLKVMDMTAISLAMGQNLPIIVFNLKKKDNIKKVVSGQNVGTSISGD
jgi:uridylate kinase